jgi:PTS system mannose-specific IIA component
MVHLIIMAHAELANSFVVCVKHILAKEIDNLHIVSVKKTDSIEHILEKSSHMINTIGIDNEILILTDIFGATPSNIANKLLIKNKIELITGLNLPMLIRAISYAPLGLDICIAKSISGAIDGVIHVTGDGINA